MFYLVAFWFTVGFIAGIYREEIKERWWNFFQITFEKIQHYFFFN